MRQPHTNDGKNGQQPWKLEEVSLSSRRVPSLLTAGFEPLASRTMRGWASAVFSTQVSASHPGNSPSALKLLAPQLAFFCAWSVREVLALAWPLVLRKQVHVCWQPSWREMPHSQVSAGSGHMVTLPFSLHTPRTVVQSFVKSIPLGHATNIY